eukprot:g2135.t1
MKCFFLVLVIVHILAVFGNEKVKNVDGDSSSKSKLPRERVCRSQAELKFEKKPPIWKAESKPLSACSQFSHNTCCTKEHTNVIKRRNLLTAAARFNPTCRDYHASFNCMACHGPVGTKSITKVCEAFCRNWFTACQDEYYSAVADGGLRPCTNSAVLCSQLHTVADSGNSFCRKMGLQVYLENKSDDGYDESLDDEDELLLSLESDTNNNINEGRCYDGSPPKRRMKREQELPGYRRGSWKDAHRRRTSSFSNSNSTNAALAILVTAVSVLLGIVFVFFKSKAGRLAQIDPKFWTARKRKMLKESPRVEDTESDDE